MLGVVLAGGRARRLGGVPKGLEVVGGARIIDRVAMALRAVTTDLLLVANDADASRWLPGVPVLADRRQGAGGLAGVETALAGGRDALVVAWDMPFVSAELLQSIAGMASRLSADVVVPTSDSPYGFEPFCALYSARTLMPLTRYLDGGGRAAHEFVTKQPNTRVVPAEDVGRAGDPRRLFFSVNTPEDLAFARAIATGAE